MDKDLKDVSILMIGFDPGLLGIGSSGDAINRHKNYASYLKKLDIIIFSRSDIKENKISQNCTVYGVGHGISAILRAWVLARRLQKINHYDVFDMQDPHVTGFVGLLLKKEFKSKLEVHFHGDFWQNNLWLKQDKKNIFYNILQKIVVPRADAIRVVSKIIKDKLVKAGLEDKKIRVINTPVNQEQFEQVVDDYKITTLKNQYQGRKIILFVGRLVTAKNLPFLLEVIAKLKNKRNDFVLLIIGEGEKKEELSKIIEQKDLKNIVFLLGAKDQAEILAYYRSADLNTLLSTTESFGKVIIEAGVASTPTLASKTTGALSIIEDGKNGYLVEINDLEGTVTALDKIISSDNLKIIGQQAKHDFIRDYSQKNTYEKVKEFWWQIVNDKL
jgi:glycosyltransferase involved in cell wall biosynthesis